MLPRQSPAVPPLPALGGLSLKAVTVTGCQGPVPENHAKGRGRGQGSRKDGLEPLESS